MLEWAGMYSAAPNMKICPCSSLGHIFAFVIALLIHHSHPRSSVSLCMFLCMLKGGFISFWMACNTSWWSVVWNTSHCANRTGWVVNWSVFKPDSPQKEGRNYGAPTCNYHMEGTAAPSVHVLWSPLKIPLRELVIIRTHDSLITPMRSSRNTAQGVDSAGGVVVLSQTVQTDHRKRCKIDNTVWILDTNWML